MAVPYGKVAECNDDGVADAIFKALCDKYPWITISKVRQGIGWEFYLTKPAYRLVGCLYEWQNGVR